MATMDVKKEVRTRYGSIAAQEESCCGETASCCSTPQAAASKIVGYDDADLESVPEGANLGLGCGNPVALASLKEGDTVLDLGSGAGIDCFLAVNKVGKTGHVIGVDMTHEMLERARANAAKGGYENVEFRLGEIEALPVADGSVDVILSNCVINLSPEKGRVFAEAFRVLKPGGRCFISDIVLLKPLPDVIKNSAAAYSACVAGALLKDEYLGVIRKAGFDKVNAMSENSFPLDVLTADPMVCSLSMEMEGTPGEVLADAASSVVSLKIEVVKAG